MCNPIFPRPLNDWKTAIIECLLARIQGKVGDVNGEGTMVRKGSKNRLLAIKSLHAILKESRSSFPANIISSASKASFCLLGGLEHEGIIDCILFSGKARQLCELFSIFRVEGMIQPMVRDIF